MFAEGEYYHLYNRGVDKRKIFLDDDDRDRFVRLLYVANGRQPFVFREIEHKSFEKIDRGEPLVAIGAYVLMPNHFHILLKEIEEGGVSLFMEKLLTAYSAYFNKRNKRNGRLFQGTYRAQHVHRDTYLKYLYAYIHLNPIKLIDSKWQEKGIQNKKEAQRFLNQYRYSSYADYLGRDREEKSILSGEEFPPYFSEKKEFVEFVADWLTYNRADGALGE